MSVGSVDSICDALVIAGEEDVFLTLKIDMLSFTNDALMLNLITRMNARLCPNF